MAGHKNDTMVAYVSDPDTRGTPSLVISCLLTLILCAWSALHLNVPAPGQTRLQLIKLNAQWIFVGIYGPELVAFTAWRQWRSARILQKTVDTLYKWQEGSEANTPPRHRWTMVHSFFASTGGFVIDRDSFLCEGMDGDGFLPKDVPKRITLSARGVEFLVKRGGLPDLPKAEIEDKSKSDVLGKTLLLTQVLWFLTQVVARIAARLPVTLLEVNTVAHVLCTLLLYGLWWHKPYLPGEPVVLSSALIKDLLPLMYVSSEMSGRTRGERAESGSISERLLRVFQMHAREPEMTFLCSRGPASVNAAESVEALNADTPSTQDQSMDVFVPADKECIGAIEAERTRRTNDTVFLERRPMLYSDLAPIQGEATFSRRLSRLNAALQHNDTIPVESSRHELADGRICRHFHGQELVCDYSKNWPYNDLLQSANGLVIGVILWGANFCYGAIHTAAWNNHFASVQERWLWRGSALYISWAGGLWIALNFMIKRISGMDRFFQSFVAGSLSAVHYIWLGSIVCLCGCAFCFARVYLVVGAFLCVRSLPQSAYEMPQWSQIFPHF